MFADVQADVKNNVDVDIWSTNSLSTRGVDFLMFADADIGADIYFQYLQMQTLKITWTSVDEDVDIRSISTHNAQTFEPCPE